MTCTKRATLAKPARGVVAAGVGAGTGAVTTPSWPEFGQRRRKTLTSIPAPPAGRPERTSLPRESVLRVTAERHREQPSDPSSAHSRAEDSGGATDKENATGNGTLPHPRRVSHSSHRECSSGRACQTRKGQVSENLTEYKSCIHVALF